MRRGFRRAQGDLARARADARRARQNLYHAAQDILDAGQTSVAVAREAVGIAGGRVEEVAETARDRAGELAAEAARVAVWLGTRFLKLPPVRDGVRRGREILETATARVAVPVIDTGTKMLRAAADYAKDLAPRRRAHA